MKVQVEVCNSIGADLPEASRLLRKWVRAKFDVKNVCSEGVLFYSSSGDLVDTLCMECERYNILYNRINSWNVRVALKKARSGFGFWIA